MIYLDGLDGLEHEDIFRCPGSAGLWRQGLVEVDVHSSMATASHLWVANYGHWFSFELPALTLLAPWLLANASRKLLVHPLPRVAEVLGILGVASEQVLVLDPCKLYFARELRTVAGLVND